MPHATARSTSPLPPDLLEAANFLFRPTTPQDYSAIISFAALVYNSSFLGGHGQQRQSGRHPNLHVTAATTNSSLSNQ